MLYRIWPLRCVRAFSSKAKDRWQLTDEQRPTVSSLDTYKEVLSGERRKSIRRDDFLKFTGGKRPLISSHLKGNLIGRCLAPCVTVSSIGIEIGRYPYIYMGCVA